MEKIVLPEIVAAGIYNSALAVKGREITPTRKTTMFELELPLEAGGVSFLDRERHPIVPELVVCAKPGQSRHTRVPYKCYYVHMIVKEGALAELLTDMPNYFVTDRRKEYVRLFREICRLYDTKLKSDEILLQGLLLQLIYAMNREASRSGQSGAKHNNHAIIEKSLAFIEENLTEDLSLERVSAHVSLSPIHFHNTFKASTGMTLRDYVEEARIKKAVNLLVSTDLTLTRIAFECGFSSQSYFSFVFKRKMNKTPREYAREVSERYDI
ncbi:MAG: helix-turn-helix transcriptional regulator [Clostridia bacterium]|nr:helix-turn-helix transcriptional regulator [Clostridia bacterium]